MRTSTPTKTDRNRPRGATMTEVVLFHHAAGLTDGLRAFADTLRGAGHTVHTPDVYEGATFASLDDGLAHAREVGFGTLQERAVAAADALPTDVVYVGFSIGVMPAQQLAQARAVARAAVLVDACAPVEEFGERWPDDVPVQIHGMDGDPFFAEEGGDLDAARAFVAAVPAAELYLYPGDQHLWADRSLPSYDPAAAELLTTRVLDLLAAV
ncbi:dienelactone hydrolase family protein [Terracoccus luteus]|nr:dienelactone hydrolase family protein [Terracoccus luteus]